MVIYCIPCGNFLESMLDAPFGEIESFLVHKKESSLRYCGSGRLDCHSKFFEDDHFTCHLFFVACHRQPLMHPSAENVAAERWRCSGANVLGRPKFTSFHPFSLTDMLSFVTFGSLKKAKIGTGCFARDIPMICP